MSFAEQLKSSVDIVDVIGQYVRLRKVGPRHVGLCPFHTEKTASFTVHAVLQFYKCFGCGAGGDVIKFVMEIEGLTFVEALKVLAERHGIPMPRRAEYSDPDSKLRAALFRMHEIARDQYRAALDSPAGAEARAYLARRGVGPALIEEFQLGLAERSGQALARALERDGFDSATLEESGLVKRRQEGTGFYDTFRGRLMFPIHDESGRAIAFGGRALAADQEPKYLNSSETKIYAKRRVLYNLHRAKTAVRKNDRSVLVEGYMDVIGVWSAGVHEVVAACGTALSAEHVRSLRRHAERIVVNFDPDTAGARAAEGKIQLLLEEGMRVRVLDLAGGLDPDEYVQKNGAENYREALDRAPAYFHWLADRARAKFDTRRAEGRIQALQFLLPAIQRVSDKLERAAIATELADYLGVEAGLVREHFRKLAAERKDKPLAAPPAVTRMESVLLRACLTSAEARAELTPQLRELEGVAQFATRRIFQTLLAMPQFSFTELEGRLEEADRELLHRVILSDTDEQEPDALLALARDSVRTLREAEREARRGALRQRAREAERAGNMSEALRTLKELSGLDRG